MFQKKTWQSGRAHGGGIDPPDADGALAQQHGAGVGQLLWFQERLLPYCQGRAATFLQLRGNNEFIVQPGRTVVTQLRITYDKHAAREFPQLLLAHASQRPDAPAVLSPALFAQVEALAGDRGFGALLAALPEDTLFRLREPALARDVDTPEALRAAQVDGLLDRDP